MASWITTVSALSGEEATKIFISSATVDGPQKPTKLDEQARQPIQPAKIPHETSLRPQSAKILGRVPVGTGRNFMVNTKRPPQSMEDEPGSSREFRDQKEGGRRKQSNPRKFSPGLIPRRDMEERRRGEQMEFNATSFGYRPQGMENKEGMKEESK